MWVQFCTSYRFISVKHQLHSLRQRYLSCSLWKHTRGNDFSYCLHNLLFVTYNFFQYSPQRTIREAAKTTSFLIISVCSSIGNIQSRRSYKLNWKHGGFLMTIQVCNCDTARAQKMVINTTASYLGGLTLITKLSILQLNHTWPQSNMRLFDSVWDCNKSFKEGCHNYTARKYKPTCWLKQISSQSSIVRDPLKLLTQMFIQASLYFC